MYAMKALSRTRTAARRAAMHSSLGRVQKWGSRWGALRVIKDALNGIESGSLDGPRAEAWRRIREDVLRHITPALFPPTASGTLLGRGWTTPDVDWAAAAFNRLSKASGLRIGLARGGVPTAAWGDDPLGEGLWLLWRYGFDQGGWERLKRCDRCRRWYVDTMKNKRGRWCTRSCYDKDWNRPARRLRRRQRLRARRPRRGGPRRTSAPL